VACDWSRRGVDMVRPEMARRLLCASRSFSRDRRKWALWAALSYL